ncbi:MAG: pyruvate kinase [Actinomycetota bacterium]|jgi:pyruvate kinase|nr:pyruvate kinase [Actinomycetota bacterium]
MVRRTKIVATIGPRTSGAEELRRLLLAGADVARINFAHGDQDEHRAAIAMVREQAAALDRDVGILVDTPGPKMRTGPVEGDLIVLASGQSFTLTTDDRLGTRDACSTTVPDLPAMTAVGDEIFLADGAIVLSVAAIGRGKVETEVIRGGVLRSRKGMHIPRAERLVSAFTEEDEAALRTAVRLKVELVGLSFVRDAADLRRAKAALPKRGHRPLIVAKIETRSAVENLQEIVREADAVMVARGDLGIQLPLSEVPLLQKKIIAACNRAGRPVITATQMLESMTRAPLPTRAEVADVANAVLDGTDALMLSEETAVGEFPQESVLKMAEIAESAERGRAEMVDRRSQPLKADMYDDSVSWSAAHAAVQAAADLGVAAILCPTRSGSTPLRVAAFRPTMPIVALSEVAATRGAVTLFWGVIPLKLEALHEGFTAEEDVARATETARRAGLVKRGDHVAVVAGTPGQRAGRTDYVRLVKVG